MLPYGGGTETYMDNKKPKFCAICFSDFHNNFTMLEPPYRVRQTVELAAKVYAEEGLKADVVLVGGDSQSDYPHWNHSGWLPYEYFIGARDKTDKVLASVAHGGKVAYVAGNHDYGQGEASTDGPGIGGSYNSADYYFTGSMKETLGELPDEDCLIKVSEHTGEKYLLAYRYNINGIDIMGLSPDPDLLWDNQGFGMSDEVMEWADRRLSELDPEGNKPIIVFCHFQIVTRYNGELRYMPGYDKKAVEIFGKHKNLLYLYGHVHNPAHMCHEKTSEMVVHYNKDGEVQPMKLTEDNSREVFADESERSFCTTVMGQFRIDYIKEYFEDDNLPGYAGFTDKVHSFPSTGTPKVAQGLIVRVYDDRMELETRNFGTYPGFETEHKIAPYTVYFD